MTELRLAVGAALAESWRRDSAVHGESHWWCVAASGLDLAPDVPGADAELVFLFGLIHDTRRENDHFDPGHGPRASLHARELRAEGVISLSDARLDLLCAALDRHSDGLVSDDATVAVCWDADRLHLPRCGIELDPALFSTDVARQPGSLERAARRREHVPDWATLLSALAEG